MPPEPHRMELLLALVQMNNLDLHLVYKDAFPGVKFLFSAGAVGRS